MQTALSVWTHLQPPRFLVGTPRARWSMLWLYPRRPEHSTLHLETLLSEAGRYWPCRTTVQCFSWATA
eukprot:scaffold257324_cov25-Prasinocladus_malaysianus.AAC.1